MEIDNIQGVWKRYENALNENRKLNLALLKKVKLNKIKSSLNRILYLPISTLIFYTLVLFYCFSFINSNLETWYYVLSGIGIAIFSLLYVLVSIRQLKQILYIHYDAPVVQLQKDLSKIKSSILDNLRLTCWILPCFPLMLIFFSKVLWNEDIVANLSSNMLYLYILLVIILLIISIVCYKLLNLRNINKNWMNWLLKGSGNQIDEALTFLDEIEEFELEKSAKRILAPNNGNRCTTF